MIKKKRKEGNSTSGSTCFVCSLNYVMYCEELKNGKSAMYAMLTWRLEIAFGCKNMICKTPRGWAFYHTHGVRGPFATFCKMFKCGRFEASYLIL